jgi:tetratricopeptide (TPR) repeat protein
MPDNTPDEFIPPNHHINSELNLEDIFPGTTESDHESEKKTIFRDGFIHFNNRKYSQAVSVFEPIISADIDDRGFIEKVVYYLALSYLRTSNHKKAYELLDTIVSSGTILKKDKIDLLQKIAVFFTQDSDLDAAVRCYRDILALQPESTTYRCRVLYNLASAYESAGETERAVSCFKKVVQRQFNESDKEMARLVGGGHYHLGRINLSQVQYCDAVEELLLTLKLIPSHRMARQLIPKCVCWNM